ncbi:MAG: flagellar hook-length control protein FliK [Deltaproteobacteria bacterium]|nr:flagellar hook-length control protein FliK [Deltaproteobacteria bacterium]
MGRSLIATVLSKPKGGLVLVSLFGRKVFVETTIPLHKGQVLNLKVHALSPKIVLKPAEQMPDSGALIKGLKTLVGELAGTFGKTSVKSFTAQEILGALSNLPSDEAGVSQFVSMLMDQIHHHPQALAYLFIPLVEEDTHSNARVSIEREGDNAYCIHFEIDMVNLGPLECTARLDDSIDVEIRASSQETVELLRENIHELKMSLEPFGVRSCEIVLKRLGSSTMQGVDVLV